MPSDINGLFSADDKKSSRAIHPAENVYPRSKRLCKKLPTDRLYELTYIRKIYAVNDLPSYNDSCGYGPKRHYQRLTSVHGALVQIGSTAPWFTTFLSPPSASSTSSIALVFVFNRSR